MFLAAYPVLFITGFPASNDALHSIHVRLIKEKIPLTYEPYSPLPLNYRLGFHLFARFLLDLIPFFDDFMLLWFLGVIFVGLQLILFYVFIFKFTSSNNASMLATILLFGSKTLFQNMYFGLYPWLLATNLFLLIFICFKENNKFSFLFFPTLFLVHPAIAFIFLVFFCFYLFFFEKLIKLLPYLFSLILTLPSFIGIDSALIFSVSGTPFMIPAFNALIKIFIALPLWIGLIPIIVFLIALIFSFFKKSFSKEKIFSIALIFSSIALFFFFNFKNNPLDNKLIELLTFAVLLFIALTFNEIKENNFIQKNLKKIFIILLLLCLLTFFFSSYLEKIRQGSKITKNEFLFARTFFAFDSEPKKTLFLTNHSGKMAEYSNKAPLDAMHDWLVFFLPDQEKYDSKALEAIKRKELEQKIINSKDIKLIEKTVKDYNIEYVVIDSNFIDLNLFFNKAFVFDSFVVYKVR